MNEEPDVGDDARLRLELGRVLRDRRVQLGLSQTRLGRLTQTDRTRVSKLEAGAFNVTLRTLGRFAAALDCLPSDLLRLAEGRMSLKGEGP